jgi:hypothetical protein
VVHLDSAKTGCVGGNVGVVSSNAINFCVTTFSVDRGADRFISDLMIDLLVREAFLGQYGEKLFHPCVNRIEQNATGSTLFVRGQAKVPYQTGMPGPPPVMVAKPA